LFGRGISEAIITYIDVSSVDECAANVEILGGRIVVPKKVLLETGYFAICRDIENNIFGIWEKNEKAQ
jgi:predicted enzyme related to lactoylglutathione lyase